MRMLRGVAIAGALALAGGACAPMGMRGGIAFPFRPPCPVFQARAYHTTSIMATRQEVQQIQARYSLSHGADGRTVVPRNLVNGECRLR
jgi:hypothetical protein